MKSSNDSLSLKEGLTRQEMIQRLRKNNICTVEIL